MVSVERRRHSHKPKKTNRSTIKIYRKIHRSEIASEIKYNLCEGNYSQITDHHRILTKQCAIIFPTKYTGQLGEVDQTINQKRKRKRRKHFIYALFCILYCLISLIGIVSLIIALLTRCEVRTTTKSSRFARFNVNMLINGDGETGACEMGAGVTSPTGWNYNGSITQNSYNNTLYAFQNYITPGPNDRGNCYFTGQLSRETTMWQTIDLNNYVDPFLIDTQTVRFNLSAWIGGYQNQNDSAAVSLFFQDQYNQTIGNETSIGPVLATDRGNQASLLFRQTHGLVPLGAYTILIVVRISWTIGSRNNGDIDNISVTLYS